MDVSKWDKNFLINDNIPEGLTWFECREAPIKLYGLHVGESGTLQRLPDAVLDEIGNGGYRRFGMCTSGGRIRFRTNSKTVAIHVELSDTVLMPDMPLTGSSGCDVYIGDTEQRFAGFLFPRKEEQTHYSLCMTIDTTETITVNFPLYNGIRTMAVGITADASIWEPAPYTMVDPIVFYGSSITQGACASRPGNNYSAVIARWLNADYIDLGFSGSAVGEEGMARYIAGLNMSALVLEYDNNAPNPEHLRNTYEPFFRIIRKAHPHLPIVGMSRGEFKHAPAINGERREVIRSVYERAAAAGDTRCRFVDGESIFGERAWDSCMVGRCHPNDLGFMRMAEAIYAPLEELLREGK